MKNYFVLLLVTLLTACAATEQQESGTTNAESSQKITITGTRIDRSKLPPGPKLSMKLNGESGKGNFMTVLAVMQSLPQPKDIGDCPGLLSRLSNVEFEMEIVDSNKVVLKGEHGIYTYTFDDDSCPVDGMQKS